MKIWKLVVVASVSAISGVVGIALTSHVGSAQDSWTCPKHPNLTIAHGDLVNARGHMHGAQVNNDFDMKGNAQNAINNINTALTSVETACKVLESK